MAFALPLPDFDWGEAVAVTPVPKIARKRKKRQKSRLFPVRGKHWPFPPLEGREKPLPGESFAEWSRRISRKRSRLHPSRYPYVRKVKGQAYQARIPMGPTKGDSLNLGLFTAADWGSMEDAEWSAGRASREFVKRFKPRDGAMPDPWKIIQELQRDGICPADLLPRWVVAVQGGYGARCRRRDGLVELPGPYADPETAHAAMRERLSQTAACASQ